MFAGLKCTSADTFAESEFITYRKADSRLYNAPKLQEGLIYVEEFDKKIKPLIEMN